MNEQKFQVECGFFDAVDFDRLYRASEMNRPYRRLVTNGVYATPIGTPSTDLQVLSADKGMNIIVKKGEGLIDYKWYENPSDIIITVPTNNDIVPRIDSVIMQVDNLTNGRVGNIIYREGTPSSSPKPPNINTKENIVEMRLANIYVSKTARTITQDAITDMRGSEECPWVTGLIKQVDTSELFRQWQAAYKKYFETATEAFEAFTKELTEDLTVNMNLIKYESHYKTTEKGEKNIPINIKTYNQNKDVLLVKINNLLATENIDYTIEENLNIFLKNGLDINQSVDFVVLQSLVMGNNETALQQISKLNTALYQIEQILKDKEGQGIKGKDALINGVNILEIVAGDNINLCQEEGILTISSIGSTSLEGYATEEYVNNKIGNINTILATLTTVEEGE